MNTRRLSMMLLLAAVASAALTALAGCSTTAEEAAASDSTGPVRAASGEPPEALREWMDRLTVEHEYDPRTGFIVAREVISLPPIIADSPALDEAVRRASAERRTVIAFATADRCAPCQQYKKDALNDPRVVARLGEPRFVPSHVEVDREGELADRYLGGRAIPMTYALPDGEVVGVLRGQRSADELLDWLDHAVGSP